MSTPVAWVLNLDADFELACGARYTPSLAVRHMVQIRTRDAAHLLGPDDCVVQHGTRLPPSLRGIPGRAFCPTRRALRILEQAGAKPEPAPSMEILRAVNSRAFAAALGDDDLPEARFVTDLDAARAHLSRESPTGSWLAKRAFTFAGKGQRRLSSTLSDADLHWLRRSFALGGGVQIEPRVEIVREAAMHGLIAADGAITSRDPVVQECDASGQWIASRPVRDGELFAHELDALRRAFDVSARALGSAGYLGPFGIDAFRWRAPDATMRFRARSEINARYTMGYPAGLVRAQRT